jgi:aspartate beta-hydroxylase
LIVSRVSIKSSCTLSADLTPETVIGASSPLDALLSDARSARAREQIERERTLLSEAVNRFPDDPRSHNALGMRALADGDFSAAARAFDRAVQLDPEEPALLLNLASAYRQSGDYGSEKAALGRVLETQPANFLAHLRLGERLQADGEISAAARHWEAVVHSVSANPDAGLGERQAALRAKAFIDEHNRLFVAELAADIGSEADIAAVGSRFQACVAHMTGKRKIYHNECSGLHFPFLPVVEFFDRDHFPWLDSLEAQTELIRAEALALLKAGNGIRPYVRLADGTPENKWSALDNSLDWSAAFLWEYGVADPQVCERCPATAAFLGKIVDNRIPGKSPTAFFSVLQPGKRIPPHTGVTNTRSIVHLALTVPEKCGFRVGGETRLWEEGRAFVFDDTIEHEAWNDSDHPRIVLIFDVWNPYLTLAERSALIKLFTVADRGLGAVADGGAATRHA